VASTGVTKQEARRSSVVVTEMLSGGRFLDSILCSASDIVLLTL